jgi:hypothetical protein
LLVVGRWLGIMIRVGTNRESERVESTKAFVGITGEGDRHMRRAEGRDYLEARCLEGRG